MYWLWQNYLSTFMRGCPKFRNQTSSRYNNQAHRVDSVLSHWALKWFVASFGSSRLRTSRAGMISRNVFKGRGGGFQTSVGGLLKLRHTVTAAPNHPHCVLPSAAAGIAGSTALAFAFTASRAGRRMLVRLVVCGTSLCASSWARSGTALATSLKEVLKWSGHSILSTPGFVSVLRISAGSRAAQW